MTLFFSGVLCVCNVNIAAALAQLALAMLLHEAHFALFDPNLYMCCCRMWTVFNTLL